MALDKGLLINDASVLKATPEGYKQIDGLALLAAYYTEWTPAFKLMAFVLSTAILNVVIEIVKRLI